MIYNHQAKEVDLVVVTDGSRVLGLGDLGVNAAGFDPSRVLPVALDFGTNNEKLRSDPHYFGVNQVRSTGEEYYALVDEFIQAARRRYPYALIHFEDFETEKAREILRRYRSTSFCFNDDIQGTAAVTLAGFLGYARSTGVELSGL